MRLTRRRFGTVADAFFSFDGTFGAPSCTTSSFFFFSFFLPLGSSLRFSSARTAVGRHVDTDTTVTRAPPSRGGSVAPTVVFFSPFSFVFCVPPRGDDDRTCGTHGAPLDGGESTTPCMKWLDPTAASFSLDDFASFFLFSSSSFVWGVGVVGGGTPSPVCTVRGDERPRVEADS